MIGRVALYCGCLLLLWGTTVSTTLFVPSLSFGHKLAATSAPIVNPQAPITIKIVGDVFLGRAVERSLNAEGSDYPYLRLPPDFFVSDLALANFESAIPKTHEPTPDFGWRFSVRSDVLPALKAAGVTHVSLANNHSDDFGHAGFLDTKNSLQANGITPLGDSSIATSTIHYEKIGDEHIALVTLTTVGTELSLAAVTKVMAAIPDDVTYTFVYLHWGEEYQTQPSPAQVRLAKELIDQGADAIVGHHPHVIQDIGWYQGVPIFYSLGNFIFDQYFSQSVQEGLAVSITLTSSTVQYALQAVTSVDSRHQPRLLSKAERSHFLSDLADRSTSTLADSITTGVILQTR